MRPIVIEENAYHPYMGDSPIICLRDERKIIIDPLTFYALPKFDQRFWIEHEKGHIELDTDNEFEADEFAFNSLVNTEYRSMKKMIGAINRLLIRGDNEQEARKARLVELCYKWDAEN